MSWRDRDYNRGYGGGWGGGGDILSLFGWSLPLGNIFGIRIRASIWLLLLIAFELLYVLHTRALALCLLAIAGILAALLLHEFGHRIATQLVGGRHDEFLMWPAGNMIPPIHPPAAWPMFAAHVGGIVANAVAAIFAGTLININWHILPDFMAAIFGQQLQPDITAMSLNMLAATLYMFCMTNIFLVAINLLPFYWFDGAYLLQAILWPMTGAYKSVNATCMTGMVVAVPLFALSAYAMNFMGMLVCGFLFFDSLQRRRALRVDGPGVIDQLISSSANISDLPAPKRKRLLQRWLHWIARRDHQARREQAMVDKILEKVSEKGMHSLTRKEKRVLHRATQRQREADLISQR